MSKRLMVIGFDGFDRELVEANLEKLPTLKRLSQRSPFLQCDSTFPPDSTTAWATIFTGKNPGEHGVFEFDDPLDKVARLSSQEQSAPSLQGNTFWDHASRAGKKVVVLFPHMGYPVWPVNGIMVGRSTVEDHAQCFPPGVIDEHRLQALNVLKRFPTGANAEAFLREARELVEREFSLAREMAAQQPWDLFFFYSSTVDLVEHFFWPAEGVPTDGPIIELYELYDRLLGELIQPYEAEINLIVLSDHGHGARPTRLVKVNEVLRREGLLTAPKGAASAKAGLIRRVQRTAVRVVADLHLENVARAILKAAPASRKVFTNPSFVDIERSQAMLSDFSGIKAYSYGGIRLSRMGADSREATVRRIISALANVRDGPDAVFSWIRPREELVQGPQVDRYPDILFLLKPGYGAGRDLGGAIVQSVTGRQMVPGSHRIETTFFWDSSSTLSGATHVSTVAPRVLGALGIREGEHE